MQALKIAKFLNLKKPFEIKILSRAHKKHAAAYWGLYSGKKLKSHLIHIYLSQDNGRELDTLIAHELIHAWQEERKHKEIHGPKFRRKAVAILAEFGIAGIYDPDCDK